MSEGKVVVVTGSTRGLGLGLAREFLAAGCRVVVNGRSESAVQAAVSALGGGDRLLGRPADVSDSGAVQELWDAAVERFGRVDIWINNAGLGQAQRNVDELDAGLIDAIVRVNVAGTLHGCAVAIRGFKARGGGLLANVEGLGSDHRGRVPGVAVYGSSKSAVGYLDASLVEELKGTPVRLVSVNPGMLVTDLLLAGYRGHPEELEEASKIFNILADRVETVAPWLVARILADPPHGTKIRWLTRSKAAFRFASAPFRKRNVLDGAPASPSP